VGELDDSDLSVEGVGRRPGGSDVVAVLEAADVERAVGPSREHGGVDSAREGDGRVAVDALGRVRDRRPDCLDRARLVVDRGRVRERPDPGVAVVAPETACRNRVGVLEVGRVRAGVGRIAGLGEQRIPPEHVANEPARPQFAREAAGSGQRLPALDGVPHDGGFGALHHHGRTDVRRRLTPPPNCWTLMNQGVRLPTTLVRPSWMASRMLSVLRW